MRVWYQTTCDYLVNDLGFSVSKADPGVFYQVYEDGSRLFLGINIGDPLLVGTRVAILELEELIQKKFDYWVQGELDHYLGIQYERDWEKGIISVHHGSYIDAAVTSFRISIM